MDEQKYRLVTIDYIYTLNKDRVEYHYYDVFVDLDGRKEKRRIRLRSQLGKLIYNIIFLLLQTLIDFHT